MSVHCFYLGLQIRARAERDDMHSNINGICYPGAHGLRRILDRIKEDGRIDMTPCIRVEIAFID